MYVRFAVMLAAQLLILVSGNKAIRATVKAAVRRGTVIECSVGGGTWEGIPGHHD